MVYISICLFTYIRYNTHHKIQLLLVLSFAIDNIYYCIGRLGTHFKKGLITDLRLDFQNENVNADTGRCPTDVP
jgi:hypothetical protein